MQTIRLYLATLEITRGINEEQYTDVLKIGIFDDLELAKEIADKELNKCIITDAQIKEMESVWNKYKEHIAGYWYEIPDKNKEAFNAELESLNLKEIYEDENELLGATICVRITTHKLNELMIDIFSQITSETPVYMHSHENSDKTW